MRNGERILIAGVGNIFLSDDGYGCEAIARLRGESLSADVRVEDYGIRGTHLAFELMSGYEGAILIDAVARGGSPGTLYVIEPDIDRAVGTIDAHGMELRAVFAFMRTLDGVPPRMLVIGCEPEHTRESIGLSEAVNRAADATPALVRRVLAEHFQAAAPVQEPA